MNIFNRIFIAVLCLALIAGAVAVIVLAWTIPNDSIASLRDGVDWLDDHNQDLEKAVLTAVAAGVALLALIFFLAQLVPQSSSEVQVTDLKLGGAVLSTAAISQRVEEAVRLVPHVSEAHATIKAKRKGVLLGLDLQVDPEANLADVTDEACQAAQDILTNRVHVALAQPPSVRLHYRELRMRRPSLSRSTPPAEIAASPVEPAPLEETPLDETLKVEEPVAVGGETEKAEEQRPT